MLDKVRDEGRANGDPAAPEEEDGEYDPEECLPDSDEEAEEYGVQRLVRGRVRLHGKLPGSSGLDVDEQRRTSLAERRFVRTVVKRGVGPCGGADFDACPDRAKYPPDVTGDLLWEMDMQQYTDANFNQHGVQARTADYREKPGVGERCHVSMKRKRQRKGKETGCERKSLYAAQLGN